MSQNNCKSWLIIDVQKMMKKSLKRKLPILHLYYQTQIIEHADLFFKI